MESTLSFSRSFSHTAEPHTHKQHMLRVVATLPHRMCIIFLIINGPSWIIPYLHSINLTIVNLKPFFFLQLKPQTLHSSLWFTTNIRAFVWRCLHSHFCFSLCSDISCHTSSVCHPLTCWTGLSHMVHIPLYNECVSTVSLKLLFTPQACLWIMQRELYHVSERYSKPKPIQHSGETPAVWKIQQLQQPEQLQRSVLWFLSGEEEQSSEVMSDVLNLILWDASPGSLWVSSSHEAQTGGGNRATAWEDLCRTW